jgi:hypothetical protein
VLGYLVIQSKLVPTATCFPFPCNYAYYWVYPFPYYSFCSCYLLTAFLLIIPFPHRYSFLLRKFNPIKQTKKLYNYLIFKMIIGNWKKSVAILRNAVSYSIIWHRCTTWSPQTSLKFMQALADEV